MNRRAVCPSSFENCFRFSTSVSATLFRGNRLAASLYNLEKTFLFTLKTSHFGRADSIVTWLIFSNVLLQKSQLLCYRCWNKVWYSVRHSVMFIGMHLIEMHMYASDNYSKTHSIVHAIRNRLIDTVVLNSFYNTFIRMNTVRTSIFGSYLSSRRHIFEFLILCMCGFYRDSRLHFCFAHGIYSPFSAFLY